MKQLNVHDSTKFIRNQETTYCELIPQKLTQQIVYVLVLTNINQVKHLPLFSFLRFLQYALSTAPDWILCWRIWCWWISISYDDLVTAKVSKWFMLKYIHTDTWINPSCSFYSFPSHVANSLSWGLSTSDYGEEWWPSIGKGLLTQ